MLNIYSEISLKMCFQNQIGHKLKLYVINSNLSRFICPIHQLKGIIKSKINIFLFFVKRPIKFLKA